MSLLLILALLSPLVFLVPKRGKVWITLGLVAAGAALLVPSLLRCFAGETDCSTQILEAFGAATGEAFRFAIRIRSGWAYRTFMGPEYASMDLLSALFAVIVCVGAIPVVIYSRGYLKHYMDQRGGAHFSVHYLALALLFFSMLGVVLCRGVYGFLFCWELMTICSFVLILFDAQKPQVRRAALNYLVMMHVGFVFLLCGFITLHVNGLPMTFDAMRTYFAYLPPMPLLVPFFVGFGMKAGLFPLHTWLPEAHPAAPSHVSAFMSGVMIKMGVYGVLRVTSYMETNGLLAAGIILFAAGAMTGFWGVLLAAVQNDIKRLLAYSSIENIGIIFMAIGVVLIGRSYNAFHLTLCVMAGALLHTFNHSLFKTLLFFGAGNVYTATHTTSIEALGGLAKKMPATALFFLVGTAAICALPPLNGFVSEFMIYYGLVDMLGSGGDMIITAIGGILALAFIGGVVILAFTKLYGVVFLGSPRTGAVELAREVDTWRLVACAIPVAGILAVGLMPFFSLRPAFEVAGSIVHGNFPGHYWRVRAVWDLYKLAAGGGIFVGLTLLLYWLKQRALKRRTIASSPTWGCGFGNPTPAMQYTGESFSEGLQSIAPHISGKVAGEAPKGIFPIETHFSVRRDDRVASLLGTWWVELLRVINARVMRMRTGKVNYYILYALLFLLLVLLLSIFGVI